MVCMATSDRISQAQDGCLCVQSISRRCDRRALLANSVCIDADTCKATNAIITPSSSFSPATRKMLPMLSYVGTQIKIDSCFYHTALQLSYLYYACLGESFTNGKRSMWDHYLFEAEPANRRSNSRLTGVLELGRATSLISVQG